MDGSTGQVQLDPSKLNAADRREVTQFIANEAQKTNIQSSNFTPLKPASPPLLCTQVLPVLCTPFAILSPTEIGH